MPSESQILADPDKYGEHIRCVCMNLIPKSAVHCPYCKKFNANTSADTCPMCNRKFAKLTE